jgi:hypothetical protein
MTSARTSWRRTRKKWQGVAAILAALCWTLMTPASMTAQTPPVPWLEPRGLSVVDLVGVVPEEHLRDAIVTYMADAGLYQYLSGRREGDIVTIRMAVSPRYRASGNTSLPCPSLRAMHDHWGVVAPESTMQAYSGNRPITQYIRRMSYFPAGLMHPISGGGTRYRMVDTDDLTFGDDGALSLPANMGCMLYFDERYSNIEVEFRFVAPQVIDVEVLGSETFAFRSYSGPGYAGDLEPLQRQMIGYIGNRHDKKALSIPAGADYVLVKFPPMPVSVTNFGDVDTNIRQPSSGTYRLATGVSTLSVDHTVTMGLPLDGQWQDADQAGGTYLNKLPRVSMVTSPEYFVPPGVEFDQCMVVGRCPDSLLEQIATTRAEMTLYYYRVTRTSSRLLRIPLRAVGPRWDPGDAQLAESDAPAVANVSPQVYLPILSTEPKPLPPDDPAGCPCGWFTADGRMVDYIPGL